MTIATLCALMLLAGYVVWLHRRLASVEANAREGYFKHQALLTQADAEITGMHKTVTSLEETTKLIAHHHNNLVAEFRILEARVPPTLVKPGHVDE